MFANRDFGVFCLKVTFRVLNGIFSPAPSRSKTWKVQESIQLTIYFLYLCPREF